MASIYDWSLTASENGNSDADINFAEGQAPSTLNNSNRQVMARVKELVDDLGSNVTVAGTANAITITANSAIDAYATGQRLVFAAASSNTDVATLSVNSIGAKSIRKVGAAGDGELTAGDLQAGSLYEVIYSASLNSGAGGWQLMGLPQVDPDRLVKTGTGMDFWGDTAPAGYIFPYGQAISRTDFAALFAVLGTKYGAGDGSTTFNVMDKRGRPSFGKDDMGGTSANRLTGQTGGIDGDTLGATGGSETATLAITNIPSHTHSSGSLSGVTNSAGSHTHSVQTKPNSGDSGGSFLSRIDNGGIEAALNAMNSAGAHTHTVSISGSTGSAGSGTAFNILPPGIVCNYILKT